MLSRQRDARQLLWHMQADLVAPQEDSRGCRMYDCIGTQIIWRAAPAHYFSQGRVRIQKPLCNAVSSDGVVKLQLSLADAG